MQTIRPQKHLPQQIKETWINTAHHQVIIIAHLKGIALSQQLEQNQTFPILCNTVMPLLFKQGCKLVKTHLVGAFRELKLLGIQQAGHKCNIKTGVRKLEHVIDETLWNIVITKKHGTLII